MEIDVAAALSKGTPHHRLRKFHTREWYGTRQNLDCQLCMAVRAGNRVYLRGQTGYDIDGKLHGAGDAGVQADQAMKNVKLLLEESGAKLDDICKIHVYINDRAWREPVYNAIGRHLKGVFPCSTGVIVRGFAFPELMMEIDVDAVIP
ncbi:MAG: RidA family protein [Proteobacteria bacterium]|nr:RidA family protein [Pseudomonadota bacterium]